MIGMDSDSNLGFSRLDDVIWSRCVLPVSAKAVSAARHKEYISFLLSLVVAGGGTVFYGSLSSQ